jgi:hypothetical protein
VIRFIVYILEKKRTTEGITTETTGPQMPPRDFAGRIPKNSLPPQIARLQQAVEKVSLLSMGSAAD